MTVLRLFENFWDFGRVTGIKAAVLAAEDLCTVEAAVADFDPALRTYRHLKAMLLPRNTLESHERAP